VFISIFRNCAIKEYSLKIVTLNYINHDSPDCWLVWDESEEPNNAVAVRSLRATRVRFRPARDFVGVELGWTLVALCETAVSGDFVDLEDTTEVHFSTILGFYDSRTYQHLDECEELFFRADKTMIIRNSPASA
jgi:hypothetical protein